MDGQIHAAVEQCVFDRLGEKPGPLELVQRTIDVLIALRLDHDNLYRRAGALELALHPLGLPQREAAAASAASRPTRFTKCSTVDDDVNVTASIVPVTSSCAKASPSPLSGTVR